MKALKEKCKVCGVDVIKGIWIMNKERCGECVLNEPVGKVKPLYKVQDEKKGDFRVIKNEMIVTIVLPEPKTASYLNHKCGINLNSIKSGVKTIKYGNGYLLKDEIMELIIKELSGHTPENV